MNLKKAVCFALACACVATVSAQYSRNRNTRTGRNAAKSDAEAAQELMDAKVKISQMPSIGPQSLIAAPGLNAQGGSAVVVNADGTLAGIFTDGDFRRHVTEGRDILHEPVSSVMTANPLFIRDDAYAAELLKVFGQRRIDDLPVCDRSGRVVGLVDIQDLPKMKVL